MTRGPKPSGKTETILARVSPDLRRALQGAADANGGSLSAEIERRLVRSLKSDGVDVPGFTDPLEAAIRRTRLRMESFAQSATRDDVHAPCVQIIGMLDVLLEELAA
jgi:hypothetical protein